MRNDGLRGDLPGGFPGSRRHNLAIVIYGLNEGGTELQLLELLTRLDTNLFRSKVYTLGPSGRLMSSYLAAGITVVEPPGISLAILFPRGIGRMLMAILGTIRVAMQTQLGRRALPVGVLPAGSIAAGLVAFAGRKYRHVNMRRNANYYQAQHRVLSFVERALNRRAAAVIGNSRAVTRNLVSEGVAPQRAALIVNGVDAKRMASGTRDAARQMLGLGTDDFVMLCVANLIGYKGHADLLDAVAIAGLPKSWRLLLAGRDDGIKVELAMRASRLGIAERVSFLGSRGDVPALLAAADIGVLVSHEEGFANTVLECMAAGLPMVVSDVGGNAEAIGMGAAGIVVPPRNHHAIATAITSLASDPALRERLGRAGRERVNKNYTFDVCVDAFARVFKAAADQNSVPPDLQLKF